jgi:hypothetical protein
MKGAPLAKGKQHYGCLGINITLGGMSHVGRFLTLLVLRDISWPVFTSVYRNIKETKMALLISNNVSTFYSAMLLQTFKTMYHETELK